MTKDEMIWTASVAFAKGLSYETLKYSDYLYGKEDLIDDVWEYVKELKETGTKAFYAKYSHIKLY